MSQTARLPSEQPDEQSEGRMIVNSPELRQFIAQTISQVRELKAERADTQTTIQAALAEVESRGLPKKAFKMVLDYLDLPQKQKENFDVAYAIIRQAANEPLQLDMLNQQSIDMPPVLEPVE